MNKLIKAIENATDENKKIKAVARLKKYVEKHPMAECFIPDNINIKG